MDDSSRRGGLAIFPGGVLVIVGVVLLLDSLNVFQRSFWSVAWRFWPVLLIAIGANILLSRVNPTAGSVIALVLVLGAVGAAAGLAATNAQLPNVFGFGIGRSGSGTVIRNVRELSAFDEVETSDAYRIEFTVGSPQRVEVEADDNLVPIIRTEVRGSRLVVSSRESIGTYTQLTVHITAPTIDLVDLSGAAVFLTSGSVETDRFEAHASGASRIELAKIDAGTMVFELSGASKVVSAGSARQIEIDASGESNVEARKLIAESVQVDLSGASTAHVQATGVVSGDASGGSGLEIYGSPREVSVDTSGGSHVTRHQIGSGAESVRCAGHPEAPWRRRVGVNDMNAQSARNVRNTKVNKAKNPGPYVASACGDKSGARSSACCRMSSSASCARGGPPSAP